MSLILFAEKKFSQVNIFFIQIDQNPVIFPPDPIALVFESLSSLFKCSSVLRYHVHYNLLEKAGVEKVLVEGIVKSGKFPACVGSNKKQMQLEGP